MDILDSNQFKDINLKVNEVINSKLDEYNINISDVTVESLCIHLSLVIYRKLSENYVSTSESQLASLKTHEYYQVAREITKELSNYYEITIEKNERYYIILYLENINILDLDFDFDYDIDDHLMKQVLDETVASINDNLHLNVSHDSEFFKNLSLHLYPAIERLTQHQQLDFNPILDEINENYKDANQCSLILNKKVKKYYGEPFNEFELSYITLHFGIALENRKK